MDKELKELIVFLRNYQLWRRGADIEQPDPTELGDRLDEAIQLLSDGCVLSESRAKHRLTTKEEAEKQVAEFDKVQPEDKLFRETSANKCWREMRDVDAIEAERDKYKEALEDLKKWVKEEEEFYGVVGDSGHNFGKGCAYFNVLEKIEELTGLKINK